MSKATKIYILIVSFLLILLLGNGVNQRETQKPNKIRHPQWLASVGSYFDIHLKETSGSSLTDETSPSDNIFGDDVLPPLIEEPPVVKGIYLNAYTPGKTATMNQIMDFVATTEVNSLVIDVKDDTGTISYISNVPMAQSIGSSRKKFNPAKVLEMLREKKIYPIARIVVFKDPYLALHRPDMAVKSSEGGLWRDYRGLYWVDPYNKEVWDYNIAIAREAAEYGFKEIQFDYIRFTSDGNLKTCRYPRADGRVKADVIRDYLKYAYQQLKPMGVKVSADVFGVTCSAVGDIGIGQVFEKVANGVDIICPMVYPSHFVKGAYGIPNPDVKPYETVLKSLSDGQQKLNTIGSKVILRAWLQDFSLRSHYGREQILDQIKAVEKAGLKEWIFWNASSKYDYRKYRLKGEVPIELPNPVDNTILNPDLLQPVPTPEGQPEPTPEGETQ